MSKKVIDDLMGLAERLGVGTADSDICLRAIRTIQSLEGDVADEMEKRHRLEWDTSPDRMGGMFTSEEINRSNW